MKLVSTLIFIVFFSYVRANKLFKRLTLNADHWQKFVHKIIDYDVNTLIECGGHCNSHDSNCDLFVFMKDTSTCHIGTLSNGNTNFLSGYSGEHHLHFSVGNERLLGLPTASRIFTCYSQRFSFPYKSTLLNFLIRKTPRFSS